MKSTTAFALVASLLPFAMAMPYNMEQRDADADAAYEIDWVTDVQVATVFTQITQYYTGEPAPVETSTYVAPTTSSAAPALTSSVPARNRQHEGGHGRKSTIEYTIKTTTTSEAAPTSTSSVAPPPPPPVTTSSSTWVAPVPTTFVTLAPPQPATTSASSSAPALVSSDTSTGQLNTYGLDMGPVDYASAPVFTASGYTTSGSGSLQGDSFKQGILQSANAWRSKWGGAPLTWNDSLVTIAQDSVNSDCSPPHTGAQNYAWGTNLTPKGANDMWGGEAAAWRVSARNGTDPPTSMIKDNEVGHFTQLVWKSTSSVGCAVRDCSTPGGKYNPWIFIACNYDSGNGYFQWEDSYTDSYGRKGSAAKNVNNLPAY